MKFETPEQRSKELQLAQRELASIQDKHAQSLRDLRDLRRRMHQLMGPAVPNDPDEAARRKQAIQQTRQAIDAAISKRDQARAGLEQAKTAAREAEATACRELVDSARPDYLKHLRQFVIARLERLAPEIVAAHEAMAIRNGLQVALGIKRESKVARLPLAFDLLQAHERFERMRNEAHELTEAGVIQAKDIPQSLRKAWSI